MLNHYWSVHDHSVCCCSFDAKPFNCTELLKSYLAVGNRIINCHRQTNRNRHNWNIWQNIWSTFFIRITSVFSSIRVKKNTLHLYSMCGSQGRIKGGQLPLAPAARGPPWWNLFISNKILVWKILVFQKGYKNTTLYNIPSGESRIIFLPERSSIYQYRPEISAIIVQKQSRTRLLFAHHLLYILKTQKMYCAFWK